MLVGLMVERKSHCRFSMDGARGAHDARRAHRVPLSTGAAPRGLMETALGEAQRPGDVAARPGYRLHPLKGDKAGLWSVSVSGNWRVVFRFRDSEPVDVDLVDYH